MNQKYIFASVDYYSVFKMSAFINAVTNGLNRTVTTENGAISNHSTLSSVLDFFSKSGALRNSNDKTITELFERAFYEDESLAMKALFYMRDVREGQGERNTFRIICDWLSQMYPNAILRNMKYIPEFGRWDDLYILVDNKKTAERALEFMKHQFNIDMNSTGAVSLLGKWLKSENASSPESKRLGAITRTYFNLSSRNYRKALTALRKKIDIVESHMSNQEWDTIQYEHVPSCAMKCYVKAFNKHDTDRFTKYLAEVRGGTKKINASVLYPYEIVRKIQEESEIEVIQALELQWRELPNYLKNTKDNQALVLADVSGSMTCGRYGARPIDVAISLAIYFAERVKGPFAKHFMTFTENPEIVKIEGNTLLSRVRSINKAAWGYNTNLIRVFESILRFAHEHLVPAEEMPRKIFIISDMQFDAACPDNSKTNFEVIDKLYKESGYERPTLVFWNVNARSDSPVTKDKKGTYLVSGCSPSILTHAMNTEAITPLELMMDVLTSERYAKIY